MVMKIPDALLLHMLPVHGEGREGRTTPSLRNNLMRQGVDITWTKSVHRALQRLETTGQVIAEKRGRSLYWWRRAGAGGMGSGIHKSLTLDEALALRVLAILARNHHLPWPALPAMEGLFESAEILLQRSPQGDSHRAWLDRVAWIDEGLTRLAPVLDVDVAQAVSIALFSSRYLHAHYQAISLGGSKQGSEIVVKALEPLGWVSRNGLHYLVAREGVDSRVKHYRIDRMRCARVGAEFTYPSTFSLREHIEEEKAFDYPGKGKRVAVRLRFEKDWGRHLLETPLDADQQVLEHTNEAIVIQFATWDSERLLWWIRGFGPHVEVLAPASLRSRLRDDAVQAAIMYRGTE